MTFMQALYGSQYYEITQKGRDGAKGRMNGNIFLAAFVILIFLAAMALLVTFSSSASHSFEKFAGSISGGGYNAGKTTGKLLAIPFMAICYFVIANTVGSKKNYDKLVETFNQLPTEEKNKANKKVLVPFFIVLGIFFITLMSSLHT